MGTITAPTAQMMRLVRGWENLYPSAVFSGINGDQAHQKQPGKHLSRSQNRDKFGANAWPIAHAKDKQGPSDKACAVDISMSRADMKKAHTRLRKIYLNRKTDPRAKFFYAFNGWDLTGSPGRYNFIQGTISTASKDHEWHEHGETFYLYVTSDEMVTAWLSALADETAAQYLAKIQKPTTDILGDDMTEAQVIAAVQKALLMPMTPAGNPGKRLAAAGWANTSVAVKLEYIWESVLGDQGRLNEAIEKIVAAFAADQGNPVQMRPEDVTALARQVMDGLVAEVRFAVVDEEEKSSPNLPVDGSATDEAELSPAPIL